MRTIIIVMLTMVCAEFASPSALQAQVDTTKSAEKSDSEKLTETQKANDDVKLHKLGAYLSSFRGSGVGYNVPVSNDVSLLFTGYIYYENEDDLSNLYYSLGASLERDLFETGNNRLYVTLGISIDGIREEYNYYSSSTSFTEERVRSSFRYGAAFGYEIGGQQPGIYWNFNIGYQGIVRDELKYLGIGGGVGLGYAF